MEDKRTEAEILEDTYQKAVEELGDTYKQIEEVAATLQAQAENAIKWTDSKGRTWNFSITIGHLLDLKKEYGIDLLAPGIFGPADTADMFAAIEVILQKQMTRHHVSVGELADEMTGQIEEVYQAFNEGLTLFYLGHSENKRTAIVMAELDNLVALSSND